MTGSDGAGSTDGGTVGTAVRGAIGKSNDLTGVMTSIYEGTQRKRRSPRDELNGKKIGRWEEGVFIPSDDAAPTRYNKEKKIFRQIRRELKKYNIDFHGIPFQSGNADFSVVSIAEVSFADVVDERVKGNPDLFGENGIDFAKILEERQKNARVADALAVEKRIYIPGLGNQYTRKQLTRWRRENHFTWHESVDWRYQLVPTIVHGNIDHTGLVAVVGRSAEKGIAKTTERWKKMI